MGRTMKEANSALFRAVWRNSNGTARSIEGPYGTHGAAAARITHHLWWAEQNGYTGAVETTAASWAPVGSEPEIAPQAAVQPLHVFAEWPKTARLFRDITITEKIDGTNAAIVVRSLAPQQYCPDDAKYASADGQFYALFAQSRKRIVTPQADNYGFARWVWDNASDLASLLGPGVHYGEWWGSGIQRRYGLDEKRFSLFNTDKWKHLPPDEPAVVDSVCVSAVPVLYRGPFSEAAIWRAVDDLRTDGSVAAPGFADPEGVCVYHHALRKVLKVTTDVPAGNEHSDDTPRRDAGKWEAATP